MPSALDLLKTKFGYDSFRHEQEGAINAVLEGRDALAVMPTGGGKSLCYQIPALLFPGLTVVISPLIALMKDQVDALRLNGIPAAFLNSTLSTDDRTWVMNELRQNKLKLLYVAPERLLGGSGEFLQFLQTLNVSLFAIDEAHCISAWGHDFRPEYRLLARLKELFPRAPTIALTATADETTRRDIMEKLGLQKAEVFLSSFNRPNIHYFVEPKNSLTNRLGNYLEKHRDDSGIIYTLSRKSAEDLAENLDLQGFSVRPYHAGLNPETRRENQELFIKDDVKIIVATIAFGMGINKSNVRFVIHVDLPKNIESYYQETGRAGRDGLRSDALLFYGAGDVMKLKKFIQIENNPEQNTILLKKLNQMMAYGESRDCRRKLLLNYFGEETSAACASCDSCLTEVERFDGTLIAQKALSAVARLEGQYGRHYVTDFLRGSKSEKMKDEHRALKTYGAGADLPKELWLRYLKDLVGLGYLRVGGLEYPVLKLTEKSVPVLQGKEIVMLIKTAVRSQPVAPQQEDVPSEPELFTNLKLIRTNLARAENVPPYLIFSDATILELATYLPMSLEDIRKISGFGDLKTSKYGQQFISAISTYCQSHNLQTKISLKIPKRERKIK
ncbi:MAG: DNA helicase RecQ [Candidatus Magasanikbacteria bacterium]|nr:DNA helicase RecQ [Candidatus Magasanikbacteria bacterium]